MPTIKFNQEDYDFLTEQADKEALTIEEYVGQMVDRQRLIVKYQSSSSKEPDAPKSNLEPPHRKWGM